MPSSLCSCQCKMCRVGGITHCRAHPGCSVPATAAPGVRWAAAPALGSPPDEAGVAAALRLLKASSGSHSPSVAEVERAIPGLVQVDACFLSNPYATDAVMTRLRAIAPLRLQRMVSHYPSQGGAISSLLAPYVGVPSDHLCVANGACEVIGALLAYAPGPLLISLPTFSAYYEFASGPVVPNQLDGRKQFRLDLAELEALVERHSPDTVVIVNPNNPDGGLVAHASLVDFVERMQGRVKQIIVDESFGQFATEGTPPTLAPLVEYLPHLVVINSMSKSHGIPGLRLGYAVMAPHRARRIRGSSLWNVNAFAEWFCELLGQPDYLRAYEGARQRYVRDARRLFAALDALDGVRAFPSAANFALLELDRPAREVATALLSRHGVYVRDCGDKWGLRGGRYLRVAARTESENRRILVALTDVLAEPAEEALTVTALPPPRRGDLAPREVRDSMTS
jgi:histidinol-phosphate/aromatic aminotransferase/cobyric acid decarboxylase-like protein